MVAENLDSTEMQAAFQEFLNILASEDTIRTWCFKSQLGRVASGTKSSFPGP